MLIINIIIYLVSTFIGYALGRIGHIYWGEIEAPHHWIYGLILIIVGGIFYTNFYALIALFFGIGVFISDLKDFLKLRFYGRDQPGKKRFWGID
jgi:hypothetical protein